MLNKGEYFKKIGGSTKYNVTESCELMPFLMKAMNDKSRTSIKSFLVHQQISVNSRIVKQYNYYLKPGDIVTYNSGWIKKMPNMKGVKIVFEDDYLIVIEKEYGLLSIATDNEKLRTAYRLVSDYVKVTNRENRIFVLHRLDRETSGLMMFAKSEQIQELLQKTWDASIENRKYIALVEGVVEKEGGKIESWLRESKAFVVHSSPIDNGGQYALTYYKTLQRGNTNSLLELMLETGRKNQIRVQLKAIGHSIAGDKKYGATSNPIGRVALHATELHFLHPITRKLMKFNSPMPKSFRSVL